jgi:predicted aldo/keto reductase-like oxidoreductase
MQYRKFGKLDWEISALGFGCMRFPVIDGNNSHIDEKQAAEMLIRAIDGGMNYIDTAFPYHGGNSEGFVGRTLQSGYRDKIKLATKLPTWKIEKYEDFDFYLNEQLDRLRTDFIDCYLLHALNKKIWEKLEALDVLEWAEKAKSDGRIIHLGFSFHDLYPVFEQIVDAYQSWDFCLIQYNYLDQEYQAGLKGLKYAAQRGMGVVIMEPLRGGRLVNPSPAIKKIWQEAEILRTPADWALQWLWNQPEVSGVISGMSSLQHVEENLKSAAASGINSLTEHDLAIVSLVKGAYENLALIPCTHCGYCVPCPEGVDIPRVFRIYNDGEMFDNHKKAKNDYLTWVPESDQAHNCVVCKECEEACPQDILISDWLEKIQADFGA